MTDTQTKYFVTSLRRVLYLSKIYLYEVDTLKTCKVTPFFMKDGCKRIENAVKAMINDVMCKGTPETWAQVKADLNNDQLHDISLLLEWASGVRNIGEVLEALKSIEPIAA